MKSLLFAAFAALLMGAAPAAAAERTATLDVKNMTCALCPFTVSTAIKAVEGVVSVNVSLDEGTAKVVFDDAVTGIDTLARASTDAGYPASPR